MFARFAWLLALTTTSCVRDDPNHCANQDEDGDAYCMTQHGGGLCSSCNANNDGCVDAAAANIPGECRPDNVTTAADDDGTTTDPSATSITTDTIADDSATETSGVDATSSGASSSETTGPPTPICGNSIMEDEEVCDTPDAFPCSDFMQGDESATCNQETCLFNFDGCTEQTPICGDGIINRVQEECDVSDFDRQTCDMQPGHGKQGDLVCTEDCTIDSSECCLDSGEPCTAESFCCSNICNVLGLTGTCL